MKRYFNVLSVIAAATLLLASCSKLAPSKAEVEAGFDAAAALPTLAISSNVECDAIKGVITVPVTVSGLSDTKDLSMGLLTSIDPYFASSKFVAVENPANGTISMNGSVTANSKYYVKAVAASPKGGNVYSEVITVDVPDIPLYYKAPGKYAGTVISDAYGDEYANVITITSDEEDPEHYCYISGIEPYYYGKGKSKETDGTNWVKATIDEAKGCLIVPIGADINHGGRTLQGFNAPHGDDADDYAAITFKVTATGDFYRYEGFYTLTASGSAEDMYAGDVTYKKK